MIVIVMIVISYYYYSNYTVNYKDNLSLQDKMHKNKNSD